MRFFCSILYVTSFFEHNKDKNKRGSVMLSREDEELLKTSCRICRLSADSIQAVLSKVEDEELSEDLNRQIGKYMHFINRAERKMKKEGIEPLEKDWLEKMKTWSKVQARTLLDASTRHIVNMMIENNSRGIADLLKAVHDNSGSVCCEFAQELVAFEEQNVDQLKFYLDEEK